MSQPLVFVTGNQNKLKEVISIMSSDGSSVGPYHIINQSIDLEELQGDLEFVASEKVKEAVKQIKGPVFVEDTALSFTAFNGLPGAYIKWFVQKMGLEGINRMLAGFEDKSAQAITTIAFTEGEGKEIHIFQGITEGKIVDSRGPTNFGWDSIFEYEGATYAEMDKSFKNQISHRKKAFDKFKEFLTSK